MNYYRKPINKVVDDVKLKMRLSTLTLKISENNNKIDSLLEVDKNIIKDVSTNTSKIDTNESDISSNLSKINDNESSISNNLEKIDNFTQYILKSAKNFEQTFNIENKHLDLIKTLIFIQFLKRKLNMTLLKMAYYLLKIICIINMIIYQIIILDCNTNIISMMIKII